MLRKKNFMDFLEPNNYNEYSIRICNKLSNVKSRLLSQWIELTTFIQIQIVEAHAITWNNIIL